MRRKFWLVILCLSVSGVVFAHLCNDVFIQAKDNLVIKVDVRDGQLRIGKKGSFRIYLLNTMDRDIVDIRLDVLTDREREVLVQIAAGATNTEIASTLYMAEGTVKTHIGRLLAKLHIRDRVGLVLFAYETGLAGR